MSNDAQIINICILVLGITFPGVKHSKKHFILQLLHSMLASMLIKFDVFYSYYFFTDHPQRHQNKRTDIRIVIP